jgi:NADPH:quinone reductase-like Zn-dependent oxidoreductase
MKAYVIDEYKAPAHLADVPMPTVGPHDVLVEVVAASINPLDTLVRNGTFKQLLKYRMPITLGHDVAGVVTEVGSAVVDFAPGDEIYSRPRDLRIGTLAEYIAIDQRDVALKPVTLSFEEAAAVPLVALAAWQMLVETAHVGAGSKVLVHAGAGGLGSTVVQLAHHLGAHVATTVGTRSRELAASLGADEVIDYRESDFTDVVSDYDLVIDAVGGENLSKSLSVLAPGGLALGVTGPPDAGFARQLGAPKPFELLLWATSRSVRRTAQKNRVNYRFFFMHADGERLSELAALYDNGALRPVVDSVFPFERALDALDYVEAGKTKAGKVIVSHR